MSDKEFTYNEEAVQEYLKNPWLYKEHVNKVIIDQLIDKRLNKVLKIVADRDARDTSKMSQKQVNDLDESINEEINELMSLNDITRQMAANIIEAENRLVKSGMIRRIINPEALAEIKAEEKRNGVVIDENDTSVVPPLPDTAVMSDYMKERIRQRELENSKTKAEGETK